MARIRFPEGGKSPQLPDRLCNSLRLLHSSLGLRRPVLDADLSPPSSAEVKNGGAIPPLLSRGATSPLPMYLDANSAEQAAAAAAEFRSFFTASASHFRLSLRLPSWRRAVMKESHC
jgi:hypothetical protein